MAHPVLGFPAMRHTVTASVSIREIDTLVDNLRREMAQVLRDFATKQEPSLAEALLKCGDIFERIEMSAPRVRPLNK